MRSPESKATAWLVQPHASRLEAASKHARGPRHVFFTRRPGWAYLPTEGRSQLERATRPVLIHLSPHARHLGLSWADPVEREEVGFALLGPPCSLSLSLFSLFFFFVNFLRNTRHLQT